MSTVTVKKDQKRWEVEVRGEISVEVFERYYTSALKRLQKETAMDGFRKGNVPVSEVIRVHGEGAVLQEAAEQAVRDTLPEILVKENVLIVDAPRVTVETPRRGTPVIFSACAPLTPSIELSDYKHIAATCNKNKVQAEVSDAEHKEAIVHFRRERARVLQVERGVSPLEARDSSRAIPEKDLPEIDDAFAKSIGHENSVAFSNVVRTHIKNEKEMYEAEKRRAATIDELVLKSKISYPALFDEYELADIEARLKSDLEKMKTSFETYLTQIKKTQEELRAEFGVAAKKRAKTRLVLGEIARKEHITAPDTAVEKTFEQAKKQYPNARADVLRANITHALQNEAVLKFLEEQK